MLEIGATLDDELLLGVVSILSPGWRIVLVTPPGAVAAKCRIILTKMG